MKVLMISPGFPAQMPEFTRGLAQIGAEVYGLDILVSNIEDQGDNATRFLVVGRALLTPSGQDKTTIMMSSEDTRKGSGVLYSMLKPLADAGISMNRIESRPSRRRNWDYVFFVDMDGHAEESPLREALAEIESLSSLFRVIGAYPRAIR